MASIGTLYLLYRAYKAIQRVALEGCFEAAKWIQDFSKRMLDLRAVIKMYSPDTPLKTGIVDIVNTMHGSVVAQVQGWHRSTNAEAEMVHRLVIFRYRAATCC
jgi:hypothetical protein